MVAMPANRSSTRRSTAFSRRISALAPISVATLTLLIATPLHAGGKYGVEQNPEAFGLVETREFGMLAGESSSGKLPSDWEPTYRQALLLWDRDALPEGADKTLSLLLEAARDGHAASQNLVGRMYDKGRLMRRDPHQALKWYESAARQGLATAQLNVGLMYRSGEGIARDDAAAFAWFKLAAEQNSAEAQYMMALMLEDGAGVERDPSAAVNWYQRAANGGYGPAQHNLAVAFATGAGVPRNDRAAAKWYRMAAEQGQPQSQLQLARAFAEGRGVRRDAQQAYVWARLAAANGWSAKDLREAAETLASSLAATLTRAELDKAQRDIAAKLSLRG